MLDELLVLNSKPADSVGSWGDFNEYSVLKKMISLHDIDSFRKLCIFPDFIKRNSGDICNFAKNANDPSYLNSSVYISSEIPFSLC